MSVNTYRIRNIFQGFPQERYNCLMKTIDNALRLEKSDPVKFRLKVVEYGIRYGWRATIEAFDIGKTTYFRWKQIYLKNPGNYLKLTPQKTRPKRVRRMKTNPEIVELIVNLRREHGNLSKYKLKPFVDALCLKHGIDSISVSLIGKIIKRKQLFFDEQSRLIPSDKAKKSRYISRQRAKKSPKVKSLGYLQLDSITTYINGKRYYFICCMDVYSRLAYAKIVPRLNSKYALSCLIQFLKHTPMAVRIVQTDNGSEFFKDFDLYLRERKIKHYFSYPRCPKINGYIERFNRTIQDEFINRSDEIYYSLSEFSVKLSLWLSWYNHDRPHQALGYLSPYQFLQSTIPKCV